jgi:uncharacterized protein YjiS (DUF1127 family)
MASDSSALRLGHLEMGRRPPKHALPTPLLWLPGAAFDLVQLWRRRSRNRALALALDDRLLDDIGVDRSWAETTWRKPFWRA